MNETDLQQEKGTFDCETEMKILLHMYSSTAMQKKPKPCTDFKQKCHDATDPAPAQRFVRNPKKPTVLRIESVDESSKSGNSTSFGPPALTTPYAGNKVD